MALLFVENKSRHIIDSFKVLMVELTGDYY